VLGWMLAQNESRARNTPSSMLAHSMSAA